MKNWSKATYRTVNAFLPIRAKRIKVNLIAVAPPSFNKISEKGSRQKEKTKNGEIHKFHKIWEKLIFQRAQLPNLPTDSEWTWMENGPNPIETIKAVSNLNQSKIGNGLIPIDHLTKGLMMIFRRAIIRRADQSELKWSKSKQSKEKVLSKSKFWPVKKWKWTAKMLRSLCLMQWTKTLIRKDMAKMKKATKAKSLKAVDNQIEATLQSKANDSRTRFHKSSNNNKSSMK